MHIRKKFEISERRACQVVGQPRSTQRYSARKAGKDWALANRMIALSHENPRYGYRRVWALLKREGWLVKRSGFTGCGGKKALRSPAANASDGGWAPLRTDAPGGEPSTRITSGATTSLWIRPRTAEG